MTFINFIRELLARVRPRSAQSLVTNLISAMTADTTINSTTSLQNWRLLLFLYFILSFISNGLLSLVSSIASDTTSGSEFGNKLQQTTKPLNIVVICKHQAGVQVEFSILYAYQFSIQLNLIIKF